jgi:Papain fold toxin 1, glutamine deamidase
VPATPAEIAQYLVNQGPGSHTVVGVDRAGGVAGHWFNAYYDGHKVYAIDARTGQILDWPPNMDMPGYPVTNWDMGVPK